MQGRVEGLFGASGLWYRAFLVWRVACHFKCGQLVKLVGLFGMETRTRVYVFLACWSSWWAFLACMQGRVCMPFWPVGAAGRPFWHGFNDVWMALLVRVARVCNAFLVLCVVGRIQCVYRPFVHPTLCSGDFLCNLGKPCMIFDHCDCQGGSDDMDAPCALRHPLVPVACWCAVCLRRGRARARACVLFWLVDAVGWPCWYGCKDMWRAFLVRVLDVCSAFLLKCMAGRI